ncbi:MAG TPA: glycosyltransferase family 9 protein [Caulobacteraceae bacterium]|jgi:ADP-heptose:LPS heptosyltransferase|nr:glycosyltransferase family 9 protein [Caulobacteraceae bacterium]
MSGAFPILVIVPDSVGDAVLWSGVIKRLYDEIPNARFTIAGDSKLDALFRDMPRLDRFVRGRRGRKGLKLLPVWSQVRGRRWGLVVDGRGSSLPGFLSAKKRVVYQRTVTPEHVPHVVEDAARALKLEDDPPAPYLFVSSETEQRADELLGHDGPILALGPGADWVGKTWPAERFNEVTARLLGPDGPLEGGRLLIVGGEGDRDAAHTVRAALPRERVIDLTGKGDLLTTFACLKRARLFIGNDTPLMHVAAAAGVPTLGLFGPSDERRRGPWGPDARAVRGPRAYEHFLAADPTLSQALNHMLDLPVETVLNAALTLLADTEPRGG